MLVLQYTCATAAVTINTWCAHLEATLSDRCWTRCFEMWAISDQHAVSSTIRHSFGFYADCACYMSLASPAYRFARRKYDLTAVDNKPPAINNDPLGINTTPSTKRLTHPFHLQHDTSIYMPAEGFRDY